ncbi:MAG: DUF2459 domain-containing protein [Tistlia sp.]
MHAVEVVSNGWHGAIVADRAEVAATGLLPEVDDFPEAAFLEFGWGDREYYPAREKTLGMTLEAALVPTPAVMHLAGLARAPAPEDPDSEILRVFLTDAGFRRLVGAIADDFVREQARAVPVAPGLYPDSHFYEARGEFHLFNTCNTWVARKLRAAGLDVSPSGIVTAGDLMDRLGKTLAEAGRSQPARRLGGSGDLYSAGQRTRRRGRAL